MVDSFFYKNYGPFNLEEIIHGLECDIKGDKEKVIKNISTLKFKHDTFQQARIEKTTYKLSEMYFMYFCRYRFLNHSRKLECKIQG